MFVNVLGMVFGDMHGLCMCVLSFGQIHKLVTGDEVSLTCCAPSFGQICRGCRSSAGFSLASRLQLCLRHEPRSMQLLHHVL